VWTVEGASESCRSRRSLPALFMAEKGFVLPRVRGSKKVAVAAKLTGMLLSWCLAGVCLYWLVCERITVRASPHRRRRR
jgi:hypothetical protein